MRSVRSDNISVNDKRKSYEKGLKMSEMEKE